MSKSTFGLRKAGLSVLAVTLTLGAGIAGAGTAYAAAGDLTAHSEPKVNQGATNQAAGDLTYEFTNNFNTNASITFQVLGADGANACDTQANIDKAIEYAAKPSASLTVVNADKDNDTAARKPSYTVTMSSSSDACKSSGIEDLVTVTLTQPSAGDSGDSFELDLSKIAYNVGKATPVGPVSVRATGLQAPAGGSTDVNAHVINRSFMFMPLVAATPGEGGKTLGDATYTEITPGAYFESGNNVVTLTLSQGTFTKGVVPQISVPSGYTVKDPATGKPGAPETTEAQTYAFLVDGPATLVAAKVTVSGLKFNAPGVEQTVELDSLVTQADAGTVADDNNEIVNVVSFGRQHRLGGADRYETAALIFDKALPAGETEAVLAGGQKFPDALSANYLAGKLDTATLLTKRDSIPASTWNAIMDNNIATVYITGGEAAVSKAIEDKLESTSVGGNVNNPNKINVVRLGGADRYATNARINNYVGAGAEPIALLASGLAPYDALAGGPIAYANGYPLVLTDGKDLTDGELAQLDRLGSQDVVILGGEAVVPSGTAAELDKDFGVFRLAGDTRYGTAAAIATWATEGYDFNGDKDKGDAREGNRGFLDSTTNIANGMGFADALSGGPLAGGEGSPILLSKGADLVGDDLAKYLGTKEVGTADNGMLIKTLRALGSTAATSAAMIEDAAEAIGQ